MGHQFLLNVPILIEADLDAVVMYILQQFPRSGYRRMIGYLLARRYRVQEKRVRKSMRRVDPEVVIEKSISPNIIQRRSTLFHLQWLFGIRMVITSLQGTIHYIYVSLTSALTVKGLCSPWRPYTLVLLFCYGSQVEYGILIGCYFQSDSFQLCKITMTHSQ